MKKDSFEKSLLVLLLAIFASIVFCLVALISLQEESEKEEPIESTSQLGIYSFSDGAPKDTIVLDTTAGTFKP